MRLLLIILFFAYMGSQPGKAQCSTRNLTITPSLGYAQGPTLYIEMGSYSNVPQTLSYFGGLQIANRKEQGIIEEGKEQTPRIVQYIDAYGRIALKISGDETQSSFYHFITAMGSVRGNVGASYRLYKSFDNVLLGIEPTYSLKNRGGINILLTSRF